MLSAMESGKRAQSSSNLLGPSSCGALSPPIDNPPLRAQSTLNLSCRNRTLSWSPARQDTSSVRSSLPWARTAPGEGGSRRNSSIDGSVAKAKMVWERQSEGHTSKKGSHSFRQQPTAKKESQTTPTQGMDRKNESELKTSTFSSQNGIVLRNKSSMQNLGDTDRMSNKRCGFVMVSESDDCPQQPESQSRDKKEQSSTQAFEPKSPEVNVSLLLLPHYHLPCRRLSLFPAN